MNLQNRKELTPGQERLLGQLSIVDFCCSENKYLALANFQDKRQIQIAKLPGKCKQGKEGNNKRVLKRRIDNGRCLFNHLPGTFNNVIISKTIVEIDEKVAAKTVKEYYSIKLRLRAENFVCLKIYALLNDKVYEKCERMLFYLLGV